MPQEDYFKRHIDLLGRALGLVLSKLTGPDSKGRVSEGMELLDQVLKEHLHADMETILSVEDHHLLNFLLNDLGVKKENLSLLADALFNLSSESDRKRLILRKALLIYDHIHRHSKDYSLDIFQKREEIRVILDS